MAHAILKTSFRRWLGVATCMMAALCSGELAVRVFKSDINHQGTERTLFRERVFGETSGWQPNATGEAFGKTFTTDEFGCRKMATPSQASESWLILGDSVTAGVGVEATATFVGRMQEALPAVRLWNTAVVGYSAKDYLAVLANFRTPPPALQRVVLFVCLNDIYPRANLPLETPTAFRAFLGMLGRNSKLYLLLKNSISDRSRQHFEADVALYDEQRTEFKVFAQTMRAINEMAKAKGLTLTVVLIPYEYQLRKGVASSLRPQELISAMLSAEKVQYVDARPWLAGCGIASQKLFLFADAMHLSAEGHRVIFEGIRTETTLLRHMRETGAEQNH